MNNSNRTLIIKKNQNTHIHKKKNMSDKHDNTQDNKPVTAKSILPYIIKNDIIPKYMENPFMVTLPSASGQVLEIGDLVIISRQTSKFSTTAVSVFTKLTEESAMTAHLIGVVQSIDAHNLINASFGGLINYPDVLTPAKNYYLCNSTLTENRRDEQQQLNRFMGIATSTNKILWRPY